MWGNTSVKKNYNISNIFVNILLKLTSNVLIIVVKFKFYIELMVVWRLLTSGNPRSDVLKRMFWEGLTLICLLNSQKECQLSHFFLSHLLETSKVQRQWQTCRRKFFNPFHFILLLWCSFRLKLSFSFITFCIKVDFFIHVCPKGCVFAFYVLTKFFQV